VASQHLNCKAASRCLQARGALRAEYEWLRRAESGAPSAPSGICRRPRLGNRRHVVPCLLLPLVMCPVSGTALHK
jgi:hypothetical protein